MFWIHTKRIIRSGFRNFMRSGFTSIASILIMTITLFVITSLIFVQATLSTTLSSIKDKVDVIVYFIPDAQVSSIQTIESALKKIPEVKDLKYTSQEEALAQYKEKHGNDHLILQVFDLLDKNPLGASIAIKASDPSHYESILNYFKQDDALSKGNFSIIDTINYNQNKVAIDRLTSIIDGAKRLGTVISLILILISIIITFNTIRLIIYMSREEINVMRLVGAGGKYIRGPFIVSGLLVGIVASVATIILFWPFSYWLGHQMTGFLGIDLFAYYKSEFFQLFFIQIISGMIVGSISSFLAVHKYLRN